MYKITFPSIQKGLWRPECQLPVLERGSRGPGLPRDTRPVLFPVPSAPPAGASRALSQPCITVRSSRALARPRRSRKPGAAGPSALFPSPPAAEDPPQVPLRAVYSSCIASVTGGSPPPQSVPLAAGRPVSLRAHACGRAAPPHLQRPSLACPRPPPAAPTPIVCVGRRRGAEAPSRAGWQLPGALTGCVRAG